MKPIHIGLLIALGVLAGVVGTRVMQKTPDPPAAAALVVATPVEPAPVPAAPVVAAEPAPSPFPEKAEAPKAAARKPATRARVRAAKEIARNEPPAAPPPQAAAPMPAPAPAAAPAPPAESSPAAEPAAPSAPAPPPPPPPEPHKVTIPVGTLLSVRLVEGLSSERNHAGDTFTVTLTEPLIVEGFVIAERGGRLQGKVVEVKESGRVKGLAELGIALSRLNTADGQSLAIATDTFTKAAASSVKEDVKRGAVVTGVGAVIGAIAGGGKGAAIGAAAGAAAGVGGAVATRGKPATLATETRLQFRLSEPVTVTEKLR